MSAQEKLKRQKEEVMSTLIGDVSTMTELGQSPDKYLTNLIDSYKESYPEVSPEFIDGFVWGLYISLND